MMSYAGVVAVLWACVVAGAGQQALPDEPVEIGTTPQLLLDGWRHGLVRLAIPTWAQLSFLARFPTADEAMAAADAADLSPVVGDPVDDPRYAEYFTTSWVDRIRPTR